MFLHEGLDHLSDHACGFVSVLTFLVESADYDFRISPGLDPDKPTIVLVQQLLTRTHLGLQHVADGLSAARLASHIDIFYLRQGRSSNRADHLRHRVRDDLPILGIDWDRNLIRDV